MNQNFIHEAGFGYAPDSWEGLFEYLKMQNFSPEVIEQAGLVSRSDRGNYIDFLRDRLVIPILDGRGRVIAFGGRAFGDVNPKYLNTRETVLFSKGSVLFGFHRAKGLLRDGALIVEGYFDVLQLHQRGINQAIAPLGTSLTVKHLRQIERFTKKIILCFDGDTAGLNAMEKGLKLALPLGFDVRLLLLPYGEDPDTWCVHLGTESFDKLVKSAPDWANFIINRALEGKDMRRTSERIEVIKSLSEFLVFLPHNAQQREIFSSLAHELRVPIQELDRIINARASILETDVLTSSNPSSSSSLIEVDEILKPFIVFCRDPEILAKVMKMPHLWWESLKGAEILQNILESYGNENAIKPDILSQIRYIEAKWSIKDEAEKTPDQMFIKLELGFLEREKQAVNRQFQDPAVMIDAKLQKRLLQMQEKLLKRSRQLRIKLADMRRELFSK